MVIDLTYNDWIKLWQLISFMTMIANELNANRINCNKLSATWAMHKKKNTVEFVVRNELLH